MGPSRVGGEPHPPVTGESSSDAPYPQTPNFPHRPSPWPCWSQEAEGALALRASASHLHSRGVRRKGVTQDHWFSARAMPLPWDI